ncbi:MAG: LamG-like jellyroll fold domain-containing protein [Patescibacteria group bacterium]
MNKGRIFAFLGMVVIGTAVFAVINWQTSMAQTTGPRLLQVADIDSVNGMQTSNSLANYPAGNSLYPGQELSFDNEGISIFIAPTTQQTAITTDGAISECGHLGIQSWQGGNYAYKLTDGNTWQKRSSTCAGYVVIGSSGQIRAQTLTIKGTSVAGKAFTLQVNVPDPSSWDNEVGGGSRRLYVSDTGAAYACKSLTYHGAWPNECEFSPQAALLQSPVSTGMGATCGNNLCQYGESYSSCPNDCPAPAPTCTLTLNDGRTSYPTDANTYVNYTYTCSSPTTVAVQVVKPDGIATTYNTATNISTSAMGFGTSNLTAGNYTLRICVNDTACSPSSLVSVPFTITTPVITGSALIGHWKFDGNGNNEITGSPAAQIVGNASFKTTGGKLGGYGYIPTGSDYFKVLYNAMFDLPDSFTIEFWFRQRADRSFLQDLVYKGFGVNNYNFRIYRQLWNENNFGPVIAGHTAANNGYWTQPSNPNQLSHNEWHNVVFTKSPNYHAYYLDGALIGSKEVVASYASDYGGPAKTPPNDIIIGDTAVDTDFDNLKIYNYALSASEVSQIGGFPTLTAPTAPSGLTATVASNGTVVNLSWTDNSSNETGFRVYRRISAPNLTEWIQDGTTPSGVSSYASTPGHAGTFEYKVVAYLVSGATNLESTPSNTVSAVTTGSATTTTTTPGAGAPEPTNDDAAVWAQVDVATGQISTTAICKKSVCGINGEYHGYVPPASFATGATWWPTSKRYIWQLSGQAGYSSGTFNFSTYIFTVAGGTIYNGIFTPTSTTTTPTTGTTTTGTPGACPNGQKCASGSWCQNGSQCYYPDSQITCVAWPTTSTMPVPPAMMTACLAGTSPCNPTDSNCVAPGQTIAYSSGKWCMQSQSYYSSDGKNMTCVKWGESSPLNYSSCKPDDTNCISEGSYGASSGWCSNGMKCNQKITDTNSRNDVYCAKMPQNMMTSSDSVSCPSGYSVCSSTDNSCREKGDKWSDANTSYYCMNAQKCNLSSGGGMCVGWNEACPSGTKYCSLNDTYCVEPGEYKTITTSSNSSGGYWCGGGSGMPFYSATKAYCEPKKIGSTMEGMMWTSADIKAILNKLGSGWHLCSPNNTNCIEPGESGPSSGWCAWMSPGSYVPPTTSVALTRCPSLSDAVVPPVSVTPPPNGVIPPPVMPVNPAMPRECRPDEVPSGSNPCMMSMYRWNVASKSFEKCDNSSMNAYVPSAAMETLKYTSCESMNLAFEKEWRTERYLVHPPEKDGQWYMPPWDASSPTLQYNKETDKFEDCKSTIASPVNYAPGMMPAYVAPCNPVPDIDKVWMLKKARAEYKMHQLYSNQFRQQPTQPTLPGQVEKPLPPMILQPLPIVPVSQCKGYLAGARQGLMADKKFWKDVNRQLKTMPADYQNADDVNGLLNQSKNLIVKIEKLTNGNKCDANSTLEVQTQLNTLHADLFSELSAYLPDIEDFARFASCKGGLKDRSVQFGKLLKGELSDEEKVAIGDLMSSIEDKLKEFVEHATEFDYDARFECEQFNAELDSQAATLLRITDKEISAIIDNVVSEKLAPALNELSRQMEERGKKLDELLVQVAELHKAVEQISQTATQISERIAVSYTALARIEEKFAEQKTEIQVAKDKLIPLIEEAITLIKTTNCIAGAPREQLVQAFSTAASVNWIGGYGDEMGKRLNMFAASCKAKDVVAGDVETFVKNIDAASTQNLHDSYNAGLTKFADVPTHEWYYGGYKTAACVGSMTQGRPAENVLRQDALLMVLRAAGKTDAELSGDCGSSASGVGEISPYAVCAVHVAQKSGLNLSGSMTAPADRLEISKWLVKLLNLQAPDTVEASSILNGYIDVAGLDMATKTMVATVVEGKLMVGNVSGGIARFQPDAAVTRASLAVILEKVLGLKGTLPESC